MIFLGIDPGVSGGLAWIDETGSTLEAVKMPATQGDVLLCVHHVTTRSHQVRACIEKVNAGVFNKPGQRMGVTSAFTFGRQVERVQMAVMAHGIPFDEVLPAQWQLVMGCRTRGDKNVSKARAQQLFPSVKVTHATADALLLAEYARRIHTGVIHRGAQHGEEAAEEAAAEAADQGHPEDDRARKGRQAGRTQGRGATTGQARQGQRRPRARQEA